MAAGYIVHLAIPTAVILLIQTHVCFLNADQSFIVLNVAGVEMRLGSSQLKIINTCLCNRDNRRCEFTYTRNSTDLNIQNTCAHKQNEDAHRNITCGFFILKQAQSIICNLTNKYWDDKVNEIADMQIACESLCVPVMWIGVKRVVSSEYQDQCEDSNSTAVTPTVFVSTDIVNTTTTTSAAPQRVVFSSTNQQPTSVASQEQSTSTTVSVSQAPTMSTSNIALIIAIIVVALIQLGIIIFLLLRERKKRKLRQTISHINLDLQEDGQHLSTNLVCTQSADASLPVYSTLREQPIFTTEAYDTLGKIAKDPYVNICTTTTNSSHITIIPSRSQILPVEEITNTPAATSQIEMLSIEEGAYSTVNPANGDIKEQTRGTSRFANFEFSDADSDYTNAITESKVPPTENAVYSVVVKKLKSNCENLDGKRDANSGGDISDYKQSSKNANDAKVKPSLESHLTSTESPVYSVVERTTKMSQ